jgi:D-amino-acid oxidase
MASYHVFKHMAADPVLANKFGVRMREAAFFFEEPISEDPAQRQKMREIMRAGISGFRHDASIVHEIGLLPENKWKDAYEILSPVVDSDRAIIEIERLITAKGAKLVREKVNDDLLDLEETLLARFKADAIVNATGLGALVTAKDDMFPLRGAVMRVINDGTRFPKVEKALVVSATAQGKETSEYVVLLWGRSALSDIIQIHLHDTPQRSHPLRRRFL